MTVQARLRVRNSALDPGFSVCPLRRMNSFSESVISCGSESVRCEARFPGGGTWRCAKGGRDANSGTGTMISGNVVGRERRYQLQGEVRYLELP